MNSRFSAATSFPFGRVLSSCFVSIPWRRGKMMTCFVSGIGSPDFEEPGQVVGGGQELQPLFLVIDLSPDVPSTRVGSELPDDRRCLEVVVVDRSVASRED